MDTNELKNKICKATQVFQEALNEAFAECEKQESEFKIPGWGAWERDNEKHIFYIVHISCMNEVYGDSFEGKGREFQCYESDLVSITPEQIESHLKKICDERYIGKKAKDLFCDEIREVGKFYRYDSENDSLSYYAEEYNNIVVRVYRKGKFAEIIPDKKKKPETWNQFASMLERFANSTDSINDVLNEYDIS